MGLALFRISLWCLPVICALGSVKLLDHSPLVIIPPPLSYLQGAHRAQRLLCVGVLGRQALFPDAELTCLSEGFGFFFFVSLQQASHHAPCCGTLMRSWHGRTTQRPRNTSPRQARRPCTKSAPWRQFWWKMSITQSLYIVVQLS